MGYAHLSDDELHAIGRLRCLVPGCGRTYKRDGDEGEVICGRHWRLADRKLRQLVSRVRAKARRRGWSDSLLALDHRLWMKGREQAIERAMGL